MKDLTQFEIVGRVWAVEQPTEHICNLTIQVVREYQDKISESFKTVKLFGGLMGKALEQCISGEPVRVAGTIKSREYNDKHYPEFIVNNLFCTEKKPQSQPEQQAKEEDDLPF